MLDLEPIALQRGTRFLERGGHAVQLAHRLGELQSGALEVGAEGRQAGGEGGLLAAEVGELLALARELCLHLLLLVDGIVDAATGSNGGGDAFPAP